MQNLLRIQFGGRNMKSKYLALGLGALLTLSLVSCGGQQAQEPQQEVQQNEPVTTEPTTPPAQPEQLSNKEGSEEISHDELIAVFEENYEISKSIYNSDDEEIIRSELEMIKIVVKSMDKTLPSDYEAQYRAWRPSVAQQQQQENPEVTLTFTAVNEQVWATGNVNLRSGPSTNDEKVGSLSKNQSVTRIGIGTGDYSNWSKVKLSDGSEVYVASSYLTTTKPTTSTPSTGNPQQSGGNTQQTGGSGGSTIVEDPYAGSLVSGEEANKGMLTSDELDTGVIDPWQNADKIEIG